VTPPGIGATGRRLRVLTAATEESIKATLATRIRRSAMQQFGELREVEAFSMRGASRLSEGPYSLSSSSIATSTPVPIHKTALIAMARLGSLGSRNRPTARIPRIVSASITAMASTPVAIRDMTVGYLYREPPSKSRFRCPRRALGTTERRVVKVSDVGQTASLSFADPTKIRAGDWVVAVGHPFGLEQTLTAGSSARRIVAWGPSRAVTHGHL
jgi:hypothetical protein